MRPQLWIIAGPNGSGKSTLADRYIAGRIPVVNPDNIAFQNPGMSSVGAGKLAISTQNQLIASKRSFAWETTMSGNRELGLMQRAKDAGYKINLVYLAVRDPKASIMRVAERVAAGGHNVPDADITRRFHRSLENLPAALKIADRAYIFDNSGERRRLVLVRELDQTRRIVSNAPKWLMNALPTSMLRSRGMER